MELTNERLQEMAIKMASHYMTKQGSLTELIAKEAQELELNSDQTKRLIETSNTLTYLRKLAEAEDRTFEFPVAEYKDVMAKMVLPDTQAEALGIQPQIGSTNTETSVTKSAQDTTYSDMPEQEKIAMISKEALRCRQVLTKMASEGNILTLQLTDTASKIKADPFAMEKLAHVVDAEDLDKLRILCGVEKRASASLVFSDRELANVMTLNSLYKEAKELVEAKQKTEEFVKRASEILEKKAIFSLLGRAIGGAVGGFAKMVAKPVANTIKNTGTFSSAAAARGESTKDAVENFGKLNSSQRAIRYGAGIKPSLINRYGAGGLATTALTVAGGASMEHPGSGGTVWQNLHN
jgi:hypothetical protein